MKRLFHQGLQCIQSKLSFEGWNGNIQFSSDRGLGRIATIACLLGIMWGVHLTIAAFTALGFLLDSEKHHSIVSIFGKDSCSLMFRWCVYVTLVCTFHLFEFFTTALYNPTVTVADSFLVNHSLGYTGAFLTSAMEFWLRFVFAPSFRNCYISMIGFGLVVVSQAIRSQAIATCGESFNHRIQTAKKDNHTLVTHGIYSVLRHPSYVGFYYWSIGTQLLLNNFLHCFLFAGASTMFFRRRIPYEEEILMQYFPDSYPEYKKKTYIAIPFVPDFDMKKSC